MKIHEGTGLALEGNHNPRTCLGPRISVHPQTETLGPTFPCSPEDSWSAVQESGVAGVGRTAQLLLTDKDTAPQRITQLTRY